MTDADLVGQSLADIRAACVRRGLGESGSVELLYSLEVALRKLSPHEFDAALFETRQRRIGNKPRRPAAKPVVQPAPKKIGYGVSKAQAGR